MDGLAVRLQALDVADLNSMCTLLASLVENLVRQGAIDPLSAQVYLSRLESLHESKFRLRLCFVGGSKAGKSTLLSAICLPKSTAGSWTPLLPQEGGANSVTYAPTVLCSHNQPGYKVEIHYVSEAEWTKECNRLLTEYGADATSQRKGQIRGYFQSIFPGVDLDNEESRNSLLLAAVEPSPAFMARLKSGVSIAVYSSTKEVHDSIMAERAFSVLVREVRVSGRFSFPEGVELIDLPGVIDTNAERVKYAFEYYKSCHRVFFVEKSVQPFGANPVLGEWLERLLNDTLYSQCAHIVTMMELYLEDEHTLETEIRKVYEDRVGESPVRHTILDNIQSMPYFSVRGLHPSGRSENASPHNLSGLLEYLQKVGVGPGGLAQARKDQLTDLGLSLLSAIDALKQPQLPPPDTDLAPAQARCSMLANLSVQKGVDTTRAAAETHRALHEIQGGTINVLLGREWGQWRTQGKANHLDFPLAPLIDINKFCVSHLLKCPIIQLGTTLQYALQGVHESYCQFFRTYYPKLFAGDPSRLGRVLEADLASYYEMVKGWEFELSNHFRCTIGYNQMAYSAMNCNEKRAHFMFSLNRAFEEVLGKLSRMLQELNSSVNQQALYRKTEIEPIIQGAVLLDNVTKELLAQVRPLILRTAQ